jgi:GT2 family glycosyltransferase
LAAHENSHPFVTAIILNFHRTEDTLACLGSLAAGTLFPRRVIVLHDAPEDEAARLRAAFPGVQVVQLRENLGYAGNNNIGIRLALAEPAEWLLLLNEDTLLAPDSLEQMLALGREKTRAGVIGPWVMHSGGESAIQSAGGRLGKAWRSQHLLANRPVPAELPAPYQADWVTGCGLLVRRAALDEVGLLDERFFLYWEEVDWCVRFARAGWEVWVAPKARLQHKGVQPDYAPAPYVTYYSTRNIFLLLEKHRVGVRAALGYHGRTLRTLLAWGLRPRWREKRSEHLAAMAAGWRDALLRRWGPKPR